MKIIFSGELYIVKENTTSGTEVKNTYIIEEIATGNQIKSFSKRVVAVATAKGLDAGLTGWGGWTPSFITRTF